MDAGKIVVPDPELPPDTTFNVLDFPVLATVVTIVLCCCGLVCMYREVPVPETEYGAELLTASIVLKLLSCCGVTFAIGRIDGMVEVEIPDPPLLAPLVVVRTMPVMVLPPETMLIGL